MKKVENELMALPHKIGDKLKFYNELNNIRYVDPTLLQHRLATILVAFTVGKRVTSDEDEIFIQFESVRDIMSLGRSRPMQTDELKMLLQKVISSTVTVYKNEPIKIQFAKDSHVIPNFTSHSIFSHIQVFNDPVTGELAVGVGLNERFYQSFLENKTNDYYFMLSVKNLALLKTQQGAKLALRLMQFNYSGKAYIRHEELVDILGYTDRIKNISPGDFRKRVLMRAIEDCKSWFPDLTIEEIGKAHGKHSSSYGFSFTPIRSSQMERVSRAGNEEQALLDHIKKNTI